MKQISLAAAVGGFELKTKGTGMRELLDKMKLVAPWIGLEALIALHALLGKTGRPPFAVRTLLRIHLMQQSFGQSDPAMDEALYDKPMCREF
jgi:IS5 family transposase